MPFITAKEGPPNVGSSIYTVQYFDENGNMVIRSNSSKAWRNNNPGNMVYNSRGFAVRHGAIRSASEMAVFPNESTGRQALIALMLNAEATISFFKKIEAENPEKTKVHIFCDNAGYYRNKAVTEYILTSKIKLHFLPPYSPNLNPIERLLK